MVKTIVIFVLIGIFTVFIYIVQSQTIYPSDPYYSGVRAFPGAEGFGANSKGARSSKAKIYFINNRINDGPGSARAAFEANGPRYIIPLVWGYVDLSNTGITTYHGQFTYAGQFMPEGQGLVFRNRDPDGGGTMIYTRNASDIIMRYLKVYYGYAKRSEKSANGNALGFFRDNEGNYGRNIIVDHYNLAFTTDNVMNPWASEVTLQHGYILYPLHRANHEKGAHGKGPLLGYNATNLSYHHNYLTTTGDRQPMMSSYEGIMDVRNNYDYNTSWGPTIRNQNGKAARYNYVNNIQETGEVSSKPYWVLFTMTSTGEYPQVYFEGNVDPRIKKDQWENINYLEKKHKTPSGPDAYRANTAFRAPEIRETSALQAKEDILNWGGVSFVVNPHTNEIRDVRDALQLRAISEARKKTGGKVVNGYGEENPFTELEPTLPTGGISESTFWEDYFNPWRDVNYPGKNWNDFIDWDKDGKVDYQLIEIYLNSWVPDFFNLEE